MRGFRYLAVAIVLTIIGAACQAGGVLPPGFGEPGFQPPTSSPPTTFPTPTTSTPDTPPTTPPTTVPPTTVPPAVAISFLPEINSDIYQAWGVSSAGVSVTARPGDFTVVVDRLDRSARNIDATGRRAAIANGTWFEIELDDGELAWIDAQFLVHQITELDSLKPANHVVAGLNKGDRLNVRTNAGVEHPAVATLEEGAVVKSTGHRARVQGAIWSEIQLTATSVGWVNASFLAPEVIYLSDDAPGVYRVTGLDGGDRLNVRTGPGVHEESFATLAPDATDIATTGKRAEVAGGLWRQIELPGGVLGWVSGSFVELQPAPAPTPTACRPSGDAFCPALGATRGVVAAFISRAAGLAGSAGNDWFADDNGSVFEADFNRLAAAGIIIGCNPPQNTEVCPGAAASRASTAAMFSRTMGLTGEGANDWFSDDNGSVFEADINRLASFGVAMSCGSSGDNTFCPADTISRGQLAAWTVRAFNLPRTTTDYFGDDNGSVFEADINAVAAAGILGF